MNLFLVPLQNFHFFFFFVTQFNKTMKQLKTPEILFLAVRQSVSWRLEDSVKDALNSYCPAKQNGAKSSDHFITQCMSSIAYNFKCINLGAVFLRLQAGKRWMMLIEKKETIRRWLCSSISELQTCS